MIKCAFCGVEQVPNTLFCSECGMYLQEDNPRGTDPLGTSQIGWVGEEVSDEQQPIEQAGPLKIRFKVLDNGREIEAILTKSILIGRIDSSSDIFPEVDLTEDNGLEKGVSRRHARIRSQEGTVVIEDLGSINGTFINGRPMAPYLPEILHDGDQLQVGHLLVNVELQN